MPLASEIMDRARVQLIDKDSIRWPLAELCEWLNEGVRAILLAKPSASTATIQLKLAKGTLQQLPDDGDQSPLMFLDAYRNILQNGTAGRAVSPVDIIAMNSVDPDWHSEKRPKQAVRHFIFSEKNPKQFFVYPANDGTGMIEILMSCLPSPVKASGEVNDINSYKQDVGLPEPYSVPLLDYVIFRAQSKDDTGQNGNVAMAHYQMFAQAIGIKTQVEAVNSPNARRTA